MVKEKIHDFGLLGKWSSSTLSAQLTRIGYSDCDKYDYDCYADDIRIVESIEITFKLLKNAAKEEMYNAGRLKVKKMTVQRLYNELEEYKDMDADLTKLNKIYQKYRTVVKALKRKAKKKK